MVEQPGAGGPNVALAAATAQRVGGLDSLGKILREVLADDGGLRINEADVQVALEHRKDTLDGRVGRRRDIYPEGRAAGSADKVRNKAAAIHDLANLRGRLAGGRLVL